MDERDRKIIPQAVGLEGRGHRRMERMICDVTWVHEIQIAVGVFDGILPCRIIMNEHVTSLVPYQVSLASTEEGEGSLM